MEETQTYVDHEAFVDAALDNDEKGNAALAFIFKQAPLATSAFTFSETIRMMTKLSDKPRAVWASEKLCKVAHLDILPLNAEIVRKAIEIYKTSNLNIRQAIHVATMEVNGITQIASPDPAFDKIKGIKRVKL